MSTKKERPAQEPWSLKEAKARLHEILDFAMIHGPQFITKPSGDTGVLMSHDDYLQLTQATTSLATVFSGSTEPLPYVRDNTPIHPVELKECT